jgi:hypothetical protein
MAADADDGAVQAKRARLAQNRQAAAALADRAAAATTAGVAQVATAAAAAAMVPAAPALAMVPAAPAFAPFPVPPAAHQGESRPARAAAARLRTTGRPIAPEPAHARRGASRQLPGRHSRAAPRPPRAGLLLRGLAQLQLPAGAGEGAGAGANAPWVGQLLEGSTAAAEAAMLGMDPFLGLGLPDELALDPYADLLAMPPAPAAAAHAIMQPGGWFVVRPATPPQADGGEGGAGVLPAVQLSTLVQQAIRDAVVGALRSSVVQAVSAAVRAATRDAVAQAAEAALQAQALLAPASP